VAFPVVLDACVLIPLHLSNLLLRLAEAELYEPLWTEEILDEVRRNLVAKIGVTQQQAAKRVNQMRAAFPAATVDGYRDLIEAMTNDPKDRHVLAAAVRGRAALIVTNNLRDFPATALDRYDVHAVHPDDFLLDQLDFDATRVLRCLVEQRADYQRPTYSRNDFYRSLAGVVPNFIAEIVALDTAGA
jgi:predicted nucleic acid-binding protein